VNVELLAEAPIPTRHGEFRTLVFANADDRHREHVALVRGDVRGDHVLTHVHSECLTGDTLGSLHCDCAPQLEHALELIARAERGVLIYLRREALSVPGDARRYLPAAGLLRRLGVEGVRLLTDDPEDERGLAALGVPVREHLPHGGDAHLPEHAYLETRRQRMQHLLPLASGDAS
jgi:3,4-dihydroxy 2-butanone 4-phosphate synthase/GTP cyclohydrolase II